MAPVETAEMLEKMTDDELEQYALSILYRELGVYGLARFLRVSRPGSGDYTRDRHTWLDGVSMEEIISQM